MPAKTTSASNWSCKMIARLSLISLGLALLVVNQQVAWAQGQEEAEASARKDPCAIVRCASGTTCRVVKGRAQCSEPIMKLPPSFKPINRRCPSLCPMIYQPVCASNGQTYGNECQFKIAVCEGHQIDIVSEGACPSATTSSTTSTTSTTTTTEKSAPEPGEGPCEVYCTDVYAPVCGSDGVTYPNACNLISANCYGQKVRQLHKGPCGSKC